MQNEHEPIGRSTGLVSVSGGTLSSPANMAISQTAASTWNLRARSALWPSTHTWPGAQWLGAPGSFEEPWDFWNLLWCYSPNSDQLPLGNWRLTPSSPCSRTLVYTTQGDLAGLKSAKRGQTYSPAAAAHPPHPRRRLERTWPRELTQMKMCQRPRH